MAVLERLSDADRKKYAGQWVAVKNGRVLVAGPNPQRVSDWLQEKHASADFVYRVPSLGEPTNWVY